MKLAIVGSRGFTDYSLLESTIAEKFQSVTEVISGGATGADSLGARWAREHGVKLTIFKPDWDTHGRSAGYLRNIDIVDAADEVLAMWDGKSRGTAHTIKIATDKGKPVVVKIIHP